MTDFNQKTHDTDVGSHGGQSRQMMEVFENQEFKELIGQNQGVSSIPIEKTDLKGFEQVARKYGVDYAITKDQNVIPPKYTVFFKAKDADALTSAFEEFTNRKLKAREKPSVLEQLNKLKELVAAILPDKVRHKSQERDL